MSSRANAAQMAKRQVIKPKSRGKPGLTGSTPTVNILDQEPQWATPSTDPPNMTGTSNGLFGGGLQAPGGSGFTFQSGLSKSFGSNNNDDADDSDSDQKHWLDNRATKRAFGASAIDSNGQGNRDSGYNFSGQPVRKQSDRDAGYGLPTETERKQYSWSKPEPESDAEKQLHNLNHPFSLGGGYSATRSPSPVQKAFSGTQPVNNPFSFGANQSGADKTPLLQQQSPFSFSKPQQNPAVGFNSTPSQQQSQEKPAMSFSQPQSIFGNNSTTTPATQPQQTSIFSKAPSMPTSQSQQTSIFSQAPSVPTQPQQTQSIFAQPKPESQNFGTSQPPLQNSPFQPYGQGLGATNAPSQQPQTTPFQGFGTSTPPQQPSQSTLFGQGSAPAAQSQENTMFGQNSQSGFGAGTPQQQPQVLKNLMSNAGMQQQTSSLFSRVGEKPPQADTSVQSTSLAPTQPSPATTTSNIFGAAVSSPSKSTIFPTSNTSNIFAPSPQPAQTLSLFSNTSQAAVQPQSTDQTEVTNPPLTQATAAAPSMFASSIFATPSKPNPEAASASATPNIFSSTAQPAPSANLFASVAPKTPQPEPNHPDPSPTKVTGEQTGLFGPMPSTSKAPSSNIFGGPSKAQPSAITVFGSSSKSSQPNPTAQVPQIGSRTVDMNGKAGPESMNILSAAARLSDSDIDAILTDAERQHFVRHPYARKQFDTIYRIKTLNEALSTVFSKIELTQDPSDVLEYYKTQRAEILAAGGMHVGVQKRKEREEETVESDRPYTRTPQASHFFNSSVQNPTDTVGSNGEAKSANGENVKTVPQTSLAEPPKSLFSSPSKTNGVPAASLSQTPSRSSMFTAPTAQDDPHPSTTQGSTLVPAKGKRRAEEQLTPDTVEESPFRPMKMSKTNGTSSAPVEVSNTSAMFKDILDSPRKIASPKKDTTSKIPTASTESSTPNPFGSILPASISTEKSVSSPSKSILPKSPLKSTTPSPFSTKSAATSTPNMFAKNGSSTSSASNAFGGNALSSSAANVFASSSRPGLTSSQGDNAQNLKTSEVDSSTGSAKENRQATKMPSFNFNFSGTNQADAFAKKALQDEKQRLAKEMEKAKDEEWESDGEEEEEEWEKRWYKRRAEEKKKKEDDLKNAPKSAPPAFFDLFAKSAESSKSSSNSPTKSSSKDVYSKSTFAQYTSAQASASRTPTPGPVGSNSSSVLGAPITNEPVKNIFGYLSDTGSGQDANDDDSDVDDDDTENKDPTYLPKAEASGSVTPASETGSGLASSTKPSNFSFSNAGTALLSDSGSSTPKRSLFDRVGVKPAAAESQTEGKQVPVTTMSGGLFDRTSEASKGSSLSQTSSDEKENTQPSNTNPFRQSAQPVNSLFGKSSGSPANHTWNPNSPLKFADPSEANVNTPEVRLTAASPTKAPSSIFGSPQPSGASNIFGSKSPTPSLFAAQNSAKASGYTFSGFGAGPSSLHPSDAGSAATSRGTSPGATTDGASDAEVDPDAEHHEQIDLTSGGPGEEQEEKVHEVRAKAMRFEKDESKWVTVGVGALRILKHKETGVSRILMRGDPSGKVILNRGILGNVTYVAKAKTIQFLTSDGTNMETYMLQVKTPESAEELATALNEYKAK